MPSSGLANRRAEKVKPSCLDYVLIFREAARIKQVQSPNVSLRDRVWTAVAEYNKTVTTKDCGEIIPLQTPQMIFSRLCSNIVIVYYIFCLYLPTSCKPWELESERWCPSIDLQLAQMPVQVVGHPGGHVRIHQTGSCRLLGWKLFKMFILYHYIPIECDRPSLSIPWQLCALRIWMEITTSQGVFLMVPKASGRRFRTSIQLPQNCIQGKVGMQLLWGQEIPKVP